MWKRVRAQRAPHIAPRRKGTQVTRFRTEGANLVAESDRLVVTFDGTSGGVARVEDPRTGMVLVDAEGAAPWRMTLQGTSWGLMSPFLPPSFERDDVSPEHYSHDVAGDGRRATLRWTTSEPGLSVSVEAGFDGEDALELRPRITVEDGVEPPQDFTYPILPAPRPLSEDGAEDALVWPAHSGWLIRRPLAQMPLAAPYPDGYHGCSVQFSAYIRQAEGGFYLATHDPHSTWKVLSFGAREWSIQHHTWDLRRGTDVEYGYPVVLAPLATGDWFEAADRYRSWALPHAPWCAVDPDETLPGTDRQAARWLRDDVGLSIWGTPTSIDWSPWYRFYAEVAGTPLHICAGWDWPASLPHCKGREGWFPANLHPANVEAWKGHHVTPYMNDLFISSSAEDFLETWEPNLVFPYAMFPFAPFSETSPRWIQGEGATPDPTVTTDVNFFMCPATEAQAELHAWRDAKLVGDHDLDGVFYDISSGNVLMASRCWRADHGHTPGRGREIVEAYDRVNRRSKAATRRSTGRYLVQGVEVINETVVGSVDFFVSRACAGPLGALETWVPAPEEPPGTGRELLPLFQAVYHDVGPVQHDGWLTLAADTGDLFYWISARIVLQWGGLLSLHYANNPPERIAGHDEPARVVNWDGATWEFDDLPEPDPGKIAFARELAVVRTEMATDYVAHGRLLRSVPLATGTVNLGFSQRFGTVPRLRNHGAWDVPEVVHGAWEAPGGAIGLLFVAVGEGPVALPLSIDTGALWGRDLAGAEVTVTTRDGATSAGTVGSEGAFAVELALASRAVTLVEITP